jgi:hypothetical protein
MMVSLNLKSGNRVGDGEGDSSLTSRRRENGRQALKVALLRKLVMKSGQLCAVKLLPKLLSKGLGRGLELEVAEAELPPVVAEPATAEVEDVEDGVVAVDDKLLWFAALRKRPSLSTFSICQ